MLPFLMKLCHFQKSWHSLHSFIWPHHTSSASAWHHAIRRFLARKVRKVSFLYVPSVSLAAPFAQKLHWSYKKIAVAACLFHGDLGEILLLPTAVPHLASLKQLLFAFDTFPYVGSICLHHSETQGCSHWPYKK